MDKQSNIIHKASLTNNCPTCFANDGLELTFVQIVTETSFYRNAHATTNDTLFCNTCNTTIYPIDWNEDIERVYAYHKKLANSKKSGYSLKPMAYWIIMIDLIVIAGLLYYFLMR